MLLMFRKNGSNVNLPCLFLMSKASFNIISESFMYKLWLLTFSLPSLSKVFSIIFQCYFFVKDATTHQLPKLEKFLLSSGIALFSNKFWIIAKIIARSKNICWKLCRNLSWKSNRYLILHDLKRFELLNQNYQEITSQLDCLKNHH